MQEIAAALSNRIDEVSARLAGLDEDEVTRSRGDGKWIKKEILGHLIDSAANNQQRFIRAQATDAFGWPGYDMDFWVAAHGYRERPWSELVQIWTSFNLQVARAMESVPDDKLGVACTIGDQPPQTLEWWMRDYLRHLDHHLAQLLPDLA